MLLEHGIHAWDEEGKDKKMDLERQSQIRQQKAVAMIRSKKRIYREMERNPPDGKAYECFKNNPYRIPVRGRQE